MDVAASFLELRKMHFPVQRPEGRTIRPLVGKPLFAKGLGQTGHRTPESGHTGDRTILHIGCTIVDTGVPQRSPLFVAGTELLEDLETAGTTRRQTACESSPAQSHTAGSYTAAPCS